MIGAGQNFSTTTAILREWRNSSAAARHVEEIDNFGERVRVSKPPWDYRDIIRERLRHAKALLDMGTGTGEFLASFKSLPPLVVASEIQQERASIARQRLRALHVEVRRIDHTRPPLSLHGQFDTVIDRDSPFDPRAVWRMLQTPGEFITQQPSAGHLQDLLLAFGTRVKHPSWMTAQKAAEKLKRAGFRVSYCAEWTGRIQFLDIGAVFVYLEVLFPGQFSVTRHLVEALRLQRRLEAEGRLTFHQARYVLRAERGRGLIK